jgi:hypothetical protein
LHTVKNGVFLPHPPIIPQSGNQISHKRNIGATSGDYIAGDYKNTKSGHPAISQLVKKVNSCRDSPAPIFLMQQQ